MYVIHTSNESFDKFQNLKEVKCFIERRFKPDFEVTAFHYFLTTRLTGKSIVRVRKGLNIVIEKR